MPKIAPLLKSVIIYPILPVILYLCMLCPHLVEQNTSWDEQYDTEITESFKDDWLCGNNMDLTQMRLQMFVGAVVIKIMHIGDTRDCGRALSVIYGVLILVTVWYAARKYYGIFTATFASFLLAVSPYWLSFSGLAYTNSDMLLYLFVLLATFAGIEFLKHRTMGWCVILSMTIGLAAASKFTAFALVGAVLFSIFYIKEEPSNEVGQDVKTGHLRLYVITCCLVLIAGGIIGYSLLSFHFQFSPYSLFAGIADHYSQHGRTWKITHYISVLIPTLTYLSLGLIFRKTSIPKWLSAIIVISLPVAVFFASVPAHTCNPDLLKAVFERYDARGIPEIAQVVENVILYTCCFLFKDSILIGLLILLSPLVLIGALRNRDRMSFPLIVMLFYYLAVIRIGVFPQVFYLLSVLPILAILTGRFFELFSKSFFKTAWAYLFAACALLAFDISRCYPYYGLVPYPYVGERYFGGHSTFGYTCIASMEHDSAADAIDWLVEHADRNSKALMNLPDHLLAKDARTDMKFDWVAYGSWIEKKRILEYDYVASYFYFEIVESWGSDWPTGDIHLYPYDQKFFMEHFEKVYVVKRPFGIEAATVWKRKR